jgi:hypothetical protein
MTGAGQMTAADQAAAAMGRCMPPGCQHRIMRRLGHVTLIIISVPAGAPPVTGGCLASDLELIDRLAARWRHRGDSCHRSIRAVVGDSPPC